MSKQVIDLFQDNDRRLRVIVRDECGNIVNITGAEATFSVKYQSEDTTFCFQKSTTDLAEGFIGAADEGEIFFLIEPDDTVDLTIAQYIWDVKLIDADGKTYTIAYGVLNLKDPVNP